jgi:hypothetical protein
MTRAAFLLLLLLLLSARPAHAVEYEVFIDVDGEQELLELLEAEEISQDSFDELLELLHQGVDLAHATRDELYELPNLDYGDVDRLLATRDLAALPPGKARALRAFLRPIHLRLASGHLRARTLYAGDVPPTALEAELDLGRRFTLGGAAVLTRGRLGDVGYDPGRDALVARAATPTPQLPKLYLRYDTRDLTAIVGSYRIGFGQRLTFDDTTRHSPHGIVADDDLLAGSASTLACKQAQGELDASPCAGDAAHAYAAPDFHWREGLLGAAVGLRAAGHLSLHLFASSALRPVYQYELYDRRACADPRADDDPACAAPAIYERRDDAAPRFAYSTLPDLVRESTLGGNLSWFFDRRAHLGATAYASSIAWQPGGLALDFQESARYPRGGGFGAVGVDGSLGLGPTDVFVEAARSFDRTPAGQGGGGDLGAILRTVTTLGAHELETALRYYGPGFANPYARPIAEPDESNGQRARDEAGARLRYSGRLGETLGLRATADLWTAPSAPSWRTHTDARVDWQVLPSLRLGAAGAYQTTDVTRVRASLSLRFVPSAAVALAAHGSLTSASLALGWRGERLRLRLRGRYLDSEALVAADAEATYLLSSSWRTRIRYDLRAYRDALHTPNPEHWLWLDVEAWF